MSLARIIRPSRSIFRWMFTYRWRRVNFERKPFPRGNPIVYAWEMNKRWLGWLRRHWKLAILMFFILPILVGIFFQVITGQTFSIYDYYGVKELKVGYSGGIWDTLWEFRGQPPGYEYKPDGFWAMTKKDASGDGLNGPLNVLFLFGFEFIFVDLLIYTPAFLLGGLDLLAHLDLLGLFFIPIPYIGKFATDASFFMITVGIIGLPIIVIALLSPFLVGWFGMPLINFLGKWVIFNFGNLIKVIFIASILASVVIVPILVFNPDAVNSFMDSLIFW